MTDERPIACPNCGGKDFEVEHLGTPATAWKVTFGSEFFNKKELKACACKRCGLVSLFVMGEESRE
ncbi:MAG: hypothetical protein PVI86_04790 [Phycisphaerae bacterium]|jgi:DNA-directed RNA polymerase subunit RPC12/RpoP